MYVAMCKVTLRLPENQNLKGKRQVLKSVITRVHDRYGISIAEVGSQDLWQLGELGLAYVSGDRRHAEETMHRAVSYIEETRLDCELIEADVEVVPAF